MDNTMTTNEILALARKHSTNGASMQSSALSCLTDADRLHAAGRDFLACSWALRSLSYSVGVFHIDYKRVAAAGAKALNT